MPFNRKRGFNIVWFLTPNNATTISATFTVTSSILASALTVICANNSNFIYGSEERSHTREFAWTFLIITRS